MASKKIKAEVRINDADFNGNGIVLALSSLQAVDVLEAVVSGETLEINLVTGAEVHDDPLAYAS